MTLYGDAIVPRGGSVWLGTLLELFRAFGIGDGAVRTATSRLTADGWLERTRVGRNSFYRLAEPGRATFAAATEHIYDPPAPAWDGEMTLVMPGQDGDREAVRAALVEAGFGMPIPGMFVAPSTLGVPLAAASALRITARPDRPSGRRLAVQAWPLDRMAERYRRFLALFEALRAEMTAGAPLSATDALLARLLLIHAYRRVVLRDPRLPAALLPDDWPGHAARRLCGELYRALLPGSEAWLDRHGLTETGPLPVAGPELARRFG